MWVRGSHEARAALIDTPATLAVLMHAVPMHAVPMHIVPVHWYSRIACRPHSITTPTDSADRTCQERRAWSLPRARMCNRVTRALLPPPVLVAALGRGARLCSGASTVGESRRWPDLRSLEWMEGGGLAVSHSARYQSRWRRRSAAPNPQVALVVLLPQGPDNARPYLQNIFVMSRICVFSYSSPCW